MLRRCATKYVGVDGTTVSVFLNKKMDKYSHLKTSLINERPFADY